VGSWNKNVRSTRETLFTIARKRLSAGQDPDATLPAASTCSRRLYLPPYTSREVLERQLRTAIEWADAFGTG
jgi:hypothetical protein